MSDELRELIGRKVAELARQVYEVSGDPEHLEIAQEAELLIDGEGPLMAVNESAPEPPTVVEGEETRERREAKRHRWLQGFPVESTVRRLLGGDNAPPDVVKPERGGHLN